MPRSTRRSSTSSGCAPTSRSTASTPGSPASAARRRRRAGSSRRSSPPRGASEPADRARPAREQEQPTSATCSSSPAASSCSWWRGGSRSGSTRPQVPLASNLAVFALFNLNLIVFLLLVVLLFRNLVKLAFERRQKVLGARFKTKLVLAFLSLALTPAILIFIIASNFINTSIEGWFKPQVERPLDQALEVAQTYYQGQEAMALRHARYMADVLAREGFMAAAPRAVLPTYLNGQQERLGLAAITVFNRGGQRVLHARDPSLGSVPTRSVNKEQLRRRRSPGRK